MIEQSDILDTEIAGEESLRLANFFTRAIASVLDNLILLPAIFVSYYNIIEWKILGLDLIIAGALFLYKPLMEFQYGATLGKMLVKIRVIDRVDGRLSLDQALTRFVFYAFVYILSGIQNWQLFNAEGFEEVRDLVSFGEWVQTQDSWVSDISSFGSTFILISILFMFFNPWKQTLHDKIADTYVVHS